MQIFISYDKENYLIRQINCLIAFPEINVQIILLRGFPLTLFLDRGKEFSEILLVQQLQIIKKKKKATKS